MRSKYTGTILDVRAVENTIRATERYTKVISRKKRKEYQIQGEEFSSRTVIEFYEVHPDIDIGKQRPLREIWETIKDASDWLWGDTPMVEVTFVYYQARNEALVDVYGGNGVLKMLEDGIPGWKEALEKVGQEEDAG